MMADIKNEIAGLLRGMVVAGADFVKKTEEYMDAVKAVTDETKKYLEEQFGDTSIITKESWEPKTGNYVWVWNQMLDEVCHLIYSDDDYNHKRLLTRGFIFRTKEEAIEAQKRDKYKRQFESMGRPFKNGAYNHYAISCNNTLEYCVSYNVHSIGQICFDTRDALETAIRIIGEDNFKKYVMGIEEDDVHV